MKKTNKTKGTRWREGSGKDARDGWFFSVLDVVGALNGQDDYQKNRNYWKWLKAKLKREGNQLVGATTQLKLRAPDGKRRASDVLDAMRRSVADPAPLKALLAPALAAGIGNRETFMKGIDCSYYYEQPDDTPPPC